MFSLILLYILILTCKFSSTILTTSKIQDSTMINSYKDNISWIVKGQLIYEFSVKYKNIKQLTILWCNKNDDKINLKIKKYQKNEFILNKTTEHDEQMVFKRNKKQQQNKYEKQQEKYKQQNHKTKNIQYEHKDKNEKIERKWKNKRRQNKNNNDNIFGIITILKSLYNSGKGRKRVEVENGEDGGDDGDGGNGIVSIKPIPIDSLLSVKEDEQMRNINKLSTIIHERNSSSSSSSGKWNKETINGANQENIRRKFSQILKSEDLHQFIVLDMSCGKDSLQILKMASDMELFNSSYHWLLIEDYDVDNRHPSIVEPNEKIKENIFVDKNDKDYNDDDDDDEDKFEYRQNHDNKISDYIEFFDKLNINMNTELILAKKNEIDQSNQENYLLFDIWNPGWQFGGKLNITKVGIFSQYNGLQMYDWYKRTTTIVRRMNMKNVPIRCMIVVTNKFTGILENYLKDERDYHLDSMHRFNFALLNHVRDLFNFSFQLYRTNSWGYEYNGTYDGMIGALIRREIEIGGSPIFFLIERARLIDYTTHTWTARPCFIFRHPDQIHLIRNIFLQPFSNDVWLSLIICGIMVILLVWRIIKFEESIYWIKHNVQFQTNNRNICNDPEILRKTPSYKKNATRCIRGGDNNRICVEKYQEMKSPLHSEGGISCVLFFIGTLCQQGVTYRSYLFSGRCIILSTLFFTFCINQFYSASIVGTLIMEKPKTIKTLRNLIESPLNIIVEDILYNHDFFRRTTDPDAIELYRKKINSFSKDNVKNFQPKEMKIFDIEYIDSSVSNIKNRKTTMKMQSSLSSPSSSSSSVPESRRKNNQQRSRKKLKSAWYNVKDGLKLMKNGGYAFHVDVATAYKIIKETFTEREICELTEIQLFPPRKMVSIVRKGSPLRKMITYGLRRTRESGLMDRQRKLWHSQKPRCVRKIQPNDLKVGIQTFASAIFILIFGLISSIIILFLEILYDLWRKFKK